MKSSIKDKQLKAKLEYIGLDLDAIPETLKLVEDLEFKPSTGFDEKKYRQYRYVSPKEIEILLSPTNRLDDTNDKYAQAKPLIEYLEPSNEDDIENREIFLRMLNEVKIEEIEEIEKEQQALTKKIPFKVRYSGNYLWQIYYSQSTDKYFMIVPIEDKDYSTFFYVLKKQLEKKKAGKIFVPITNANYSKQLLNKTEIQSLENYLWVFTNDWPSIYEVYDKTGKVSLQVVGQTEIYNKIKSEYKVKLSNQIEANKFFKLVKALFILQSELLPYYKFETQIDKQAELEFYYEGKQLKYDDLSDWINEQYKKFIEKEKKIKQDKKDAIQKFEKFKEQSQNLEVEYLSKEKQISTFLECKKSFFGKVKYYFKYGKKAKNKKEVTKLKTEEKLEITQNDEIEENIKKQYTLDELLEKGKKILEKENELKNIIMDINAIKLKNVNLLKKIENATAYIEEIDRHKKSIFEFWKYSNKDEVQALEEGEEEPINVKTHSEVFEFDEDFEEFGINMDKIQQEIYTKDELDCIYLATTNQIEIMNKLKTKTTEAKEVDRWLKEIKEDLKNDKDITEEEAIDIFGGLSEDTRKVKKLANKTHREQPKNKYSILRISKSTKAVNYRADLNNAIKVIQEALEKNKLNEDISVYMWTEEDGNIDANKINIFNLDAEAEIQDAINKTEDNKINLYRINLKKGINVIAFTNCVYYDNQNKTLPVGMDRDTRIIANLSNTDVKLDSKKVIRIAKLENEEVESKLISKAINVFEYTVKELV